MLKQEIISNFKSHDRDTGSPEVQIALLTKRINQISDHIKHHTKDFSGKRGLLILIAQRNAMLKYLVRLDEARYRVVCAKLSLRSKF